MAETVAFLLFVASIILCSASGVSVVFALILGFAVFTIYGLIKGFALKALVPMMMKGVRTTAVVVTMMALIGMLTGSWRASGTVARLVGDAAQFISPAWSLLTVFIINGAVSTLLGTSFGTAATMGVVSMTMTNAMGVDPLFAGGAILAGVYVGDRCSPVSSSAALVAAVTRTKIYENIRTMLITGAVPLMLSFFIYAALGLILPGHATNMTVSTIFAKEFDLGFATFIPAAVLLALVFCRVPIRLTMLASILSAVAVCLFCQGQSWTSVAHTLIFGFTAQNPVVGKMVDGGGLVSMTPVCLIILISSTFSGLFEGTGLIKTLNEQIPKLARRVTPCGAVILTAIITSAVACNQALAVLLTDQLSRSIVSEDRRRAALLEDSAIVIAPLIPWSIAGAVPIATVGAPAACVLTAFYLWLLPACTFFSELHKSHSTPS